MKHGIKTKIPAVVGWTSLVGIIGECPVSWGNYFSFLNERYALDYGPRCVNMWAENLNEAKKRFLDDGMVEGYLFTSKGHKFFVVCDKRIPVDWLYNKFCFTGGSGPDVEVAEEMYSIHGDPTNELEQFVDPVSYYAKRGGEYIVTKGGYAIIRYKIQANPKPLKSMDS